MKKSGNLFNDLRINLNLLIRPYVSIIINLFVSYKILFNPLGTITLLLSCFQQLLIYVLDTFNTLKTEWKSLHVINICINIVL